LTAPMGRSEVFFAQDLSLVHSFYLFLLETSFGHEVPVPTSIAHDTSVLHRFVLLLDRAVTPQMIRDGFRISEHKTNAEALLRFYAAKPQRSRDDRDKADVIATVLFRSTLGFDTADLQEAEDKLAIENFETWLTRIYRDAKMPDPPNEHMQLVREFERIRDEVESCQQLDALIDSGIMKKVRDIKQTLADSFLHPRVLSVMAAHNVFFHRKFDDLFLQAAKDVRAFAANMQQDGGSMMIPMQGDITLDDLNKLKEDSLDNDEDLGEVSRLNRELRKQRQSRVAERPPQTSNVSKAREEHAEPRATAQPSAEDAAVPVSETRPKAAPAPAYVMPKSASNIAEVEAQALREVREAIRRFVLAADENSANLVPLPHGNVTLTKWEVEAFRSEPESEGSFGGDIAASLTQMAALDARLLAELKEFEATRHTAYNWKPHADALAHLLGVGRDIVDQAMHLAVVAKQRGLENEAAGLLESIENIRPRGKSTVDALQSLGEQAG
jgi:hypothetical protein